jgi:hypothetical protein
MNSLEESTPKKKIYLHIGHGKTGTSSIQSVLAKAEADLKAANVSYPYDPSFANAKKGLISSGNIDVQKNKKDWLERVIMQATQNQSAHKTFIFSSEIIFWHMDPFFSGFDKYKNEWDFEIVLCVRDPFDTLSSTYQQFVKQSGYTISFEQFLEQHDFKEQHAIRAVTLLKQFAELQIKTNLFNYTAIGRNICSRVLEAMNIHAVASKHISEVKTVNRSLNAAELQLALLLNSAFGRAAGARVSNALVNELPELHSTTLTYSPESVTNIKKNMQPFVDELNLRLPKAEHLILNPSACHDIESRCSLLNSAQTNVACAELLNYFKEVQTNPEGPAARQLLCNSNGLMPVAYLVLFFLLGSAGHSRIPLDRQTLAIIVEESRVASCHSGLCYRFDQNQLLGYFDYFSAGDFDLLQQHVLISQKLNALTHVGLRPSEILDLFAVVHRVKLRVAVD